MRKLLLYLFTLMVMLSCRNEDIDPDKYIYPISLQSSRNTEGIQLRWYSALALYRSNMMWPPGGVSGERIEVLYSKDDTLDYTVIHQASGEFSDTFLLPVAESGSHHFFRLRATAENVKPYLSNIIHVQFDSNPTFEPLVEYPNTTPIVLGNFSSDGSGFVYSNYEEYVIDEEQHEGYVTVLFDEISTQAEMLFPNANSPVWAPGENLIAFQYFSNDSPNRLYSNIGLYVLSEDSIVQLTTGEHQFDKPVWHPDGQSILFLSQNIEDGAYYDLYVYDINSGDFGALPTASGITVGHFRPSYSPDGQKIAFADYTEEYRYQIFLFTVETGQVDPMENSLWENHSPAISPDGKWMAFLSNRSGLSEIWVKDLQSGELFQITGDETIYIESGLSWSPDSEKIYLKAYKEEQYGIYSVTVR